MPPPRTRAYLLLVHPLRFAARTIRGFNANQGLLMAGAIAYYALLSLIPLLILSVIAASHLLGFLVEAAVFTAMYLVLPAGRTRPGHALLGGATAAAIWEVVRHALIWYFASLSQVSIVYGSLTTAIVSLFSMEVIAILVLFGAQVISEYERLGDG